MIRVHEQFAFPTRLAARYSLTEGSLVQRERLCFALVLTPQTAVCRIYIYIP